jgi:hypothetical protein
MSLMSQPCFLEEGRYVSMGIYLNLAKTVHTEQRWTGESTQRSALHTQVREKDPHRRRDKSDISDRSFVRVKGETARNATLTVREVLEEINTPNTGAAIQAAFCLRGEITKENAIRWITCAVLHRRGESFEGWERHAPAAEAAFERWTEES